MLLIFVLSAANHGDDAFQGLLWMIFRSDENYCLATTATTRWSKAKEACDKSFVKIQSGHFSVSHTFFRTCTQNTRPLNTHIHTNTFSMGCMHDYTYCTKSCRSKTIKAGIGREVDPCIPEPAPSSPSSHHLSNCMRDLLWTAP